MLNISREEFVAKVKTIANTYYEAHSTYVYNSVLTEKYYVGGYTGGNCWDDTEPYYDPSDSTPKFGVLDELLLEVAPSISLLKYKEIEKLVEEGSYTDREYYGNTSDYVTFSIDLDKLYAILTQE